MGNFPRLSKIFGPANFLSRKFFTSPEVRVADHVVPRVAPPWVSTHTALCCNHGVLWLTPFGTLTLKPATQIPMTHRIHQASVVPQLTTTPLLALGTLAPWAALTT